MTKLARDPSEGTAGSRLHRGGLGRVPIVEVVGKNYQGQENDEATRRKAMG